METSLSHKLQEVNVLGAKDPEWGVTLSCVLFYYDYEIYFIFGTTLLTRHNSPQYELKHKHKVFHEEL